MANVKNLRYAYMRWVTTLNSLVKRPSGPVRERISVKRPPEDYLRQAMVRTLDMREVEIDFRVQLQTDPFLMPIENAAVLWPERLSPRVSVATIRIPRQTFDSPAQINFEKQLSYNPWHCIAEHRPLGNQSRARKRMYLALSKFRHDMNAIPHYEPTGDEKFP